MVQTICICGAGTMGTGIAQVSAQHGFRTVLYDVNANMLEIAKQKFMQSLHGLVEKNKIAVAEQQRCLANTRFTSVISDCIADVVIEAIVENLEVKLDLFRELAAVNADTTILATNTSSLSITAIAAKVKDPDRVAGLHFFNPAPSMKLVEVIAGAQTSAQTISILAATAQQMGKTAVHCKDAPGFIVNHVARPYYLEALRLAEQGIDVATIDELLVSSGFRMGPFRLMDLIGNDINYAVSSGLYEALNKPARLQPSAIQQQKLEKGELGKKTGKGYYVYP